MPCTSFDGFIINEREWFRVLETVCGRSVVFVDCAVSYSGWYPGDGVEIILYFSSNL